MRVTFMKKTWLRACFASAPMAVMFVAVTVGMLPEMAWAQAAEPTRVETTGGRFWQGRLISENDREVVLLTAGGPLTIPRAAIRRMSSSTPLSPPLSTGLFPPGGAGARAVVPVALPAPLARLRVAERQGALRLSGENALATQLMPALLADYGKEAGLDTTREEMAPDPAERLYRIEGAETNRGIRAEVRAYGTARAFGDLGANRTDLGMAARRIGETELRALAVSGAGNLRQPGLEQVVALSGVAVIVHRDNPIKVLTQEQVRDMLNGVLTRWSDVGGPPLPVAVYALDDADDASVLVRQRVLGPLDRLSPRARRFESHEDLTDALAADPGGIGFVSIAHVRNARSVGLRLSCGLTFEATPFHLRSEEYPLAQRMYLYASARTPALGRDFLAYAISDRAQSAIATAGFVNLAPLVATPAETAGQVAAAGEALPAELRAIAAPQVAQFRQIVAGAQRLSVTFRFEAGRAELDARAEADIGRLASWMRERNSSGKSLLLLGHASIDGPYATNLVLSRARAQTVATRLGALGIPVAQVESVGPVSPVACADGMGDSDINRRVEVWIK